MIFFKHQLRNTLNYVLRPDTSEMLKRDVRPWPGRYGDATMTYLWKVNIPSHIYTKQ